MCFSSCSLYYNVILNTYAFIIIKGMLKNVCAYVFTYSHSGMSIAKTNFKKKFLMCKTEQILQENLLCREEPVSNPTF